MNLNFKEDVRTATYQPTKAGEQFEELLRSKLGLAHKYESARLAIGRSLADPSTPAARDSAPAGTALKGEQLFGTEIDLWLSLLILDGEFSTTATVDDFRHHVEAHWARGSRLLQDDLANCGDDETKLLSRLAELLQPLTDTAAVRPATSRQGGVRLRLGPVSQTFPSAEPVEFTLNGQGASPHIALMGRSGTGKTTTGIQMAIDIIRSAELPFLMIDPKGEFVEGGKLVGPFSQLRLPPTAIEVGETAIPLDFLPEPGVGTASVARAAMQFRDSLASCCKSVGDIQQSLLKTTVEKVIKHSPTRDLWAVREQYASELEAANRQFDSVSGRLDELTTLSVFAPKLPARDFFARSWVLSLRQLGTEELKRLVVLLVLDALKAHVLSLADTTVVDGFRELRHLLVIDEARRILAEKRNASLVDLVREGRSRGLVVMLLSQDPSDFDGHTEDFTKQLGTVVAFSCAQSPRGLKALQGAYGRRLQPLEFSEKQLPAGVAFAKVPGREAERIRCWGQNLEQ